MEWKSFQKYISIVKDCVDAKKAFILENIVDVKKLSKVKFCWCWKLLKASYASEIYLMWKLFELCFAFRIEK